MHCLDYDFAQIGHVDFTYLCLVTQKCIGIPNNDEMTQAFEILPHERQWSDRLSCIVNSISGDGGPDNGRTHCSDVMMGTIVSQITSLTIVYSTAYSGADQRTHQSSASLAFVRGIHRWPVNSLHKWPITRKMFPFDNVIMHFAAPLPLLHGNILS